MGKVKEQLLNHIHHLDDDVLETELANRYQDESEYQEWLESKEFVEYVNDQIESTKPRYSDIHVTSAIQYASRMITIEPSEVGKEVYDKIFSEKIEEYLHECR